MLNNPISTLFLEGTLAFVYTQFTKSLIIITFSVFLADKKQFNMFSWWQLSQLLQFYKLKIKHK